MWTVVMAACHKWLSPDGHLPLSMHLCTGPFLSGKARRRISWTDFPSHQILTGWEDHGIFKLVSPFFPPWHFHTFLFSSQCPPFLLSFLPYDFASYINCINSYQTWTPSSHHHHINEHSLKTSFTLDHLLNMGMYLTVSGFHPISTSKIWTFQLFCLMHF